MSLFVLLNVFSAASAATLYYNQYAADNNAVRDCGFGKPLTHMFTVQLEADRCQKITVPYIGDEKYMMVKTNPNTSKVDMLFDVCDPTCANCVDVVNGISETCFAVLEGSGAVYNDYCAGSNNLETELSLSAKFFGTDNCSVVKGDKHDVQFIRNYPMRSTGGCITDSQVINNWYYYSLDIKGEGESATYDAKFGCTDKECETCEYVLSDKTEDSCEKGSSGSGSLKVVPSSKLTNCGGGPPPPPPPPGDKYSCKDNRCQKDESGEYPSEADCSKECNPSNKKYKCSGSPDYQCVEDEGGITKDDCDLQCVSDTYACIDEKCVVDAKGVAKETCEAICTASLPFLTQKHGYRCVQGKVVPTTYGGQPYDVVSKICKSSKTQQ